MIRDISIRTKQSDPSMTKKDQGRAIRSRRGFSLFEVIVGAIVLGIGLTAVVSVTSRSLNNQARGERIMVASWLADELLSTVVVEGPHTFITQRSREGNFDDMFGEYTYIIDIQMFSEREPYLVTAVVGWPPYDESSLVQVQTWIAKRQGEDPEPPPRVPSEPIDRYSRYYDDQ